MMLTKAEISARLAKGDLKVAPDPDWSEAGPCDLPLRLSRRHAILLPREGAVRVAREPGLERVGAVAEPVFAVSEGTSFTLQPHSRLLALSLERLVMPRDLVALVALRSTYARLGLLTAPTIVDPGFEGNLVLELAGGPFSVSLTAGDAVFKLVFWRMSGPSDPYVGQYQRQTDICLPHLEI